MTNPTYRPFRRLSRLTTATVSLLGAGGIAAVPALVRAATPPAPNPAAAPHITFEDYRLPNGLRVILAPDHSAPVVSIAVTYNVGSRDEKPGRTGFAHLFEHLMFQGSENIGRGEHFQLVDDNGGSMNGTTNSDRTNYFESMPANQLSMEIFMEADRMRALDVSQSNLDNQREVVKEEKRSRVDNQPGGALQAVLLETAYEGFPYRHTTIGSMEDLDAARLEDVRAFYKTYYAPNNAVLALSGDFDPKKAKEEIAKRFGVIAAQPAPPPVIVGETLHRGERRKTVQDPLTDRRRYVQVYTTVAGNDPDFPALSVLGTILGRGRTSRLYAPLYEARKASTFQAGIQESRGPSLFQVSVSPNRSATIEELETAVDTEIARIVKDGVTTDELHRAQKQAQVGALRRVEGTMARAQSLSQNAVFYNDPGRINTFVGKIQAVTPDDVRRVAAKYLTKDNRAVLVVEPTGAARPGRPGVVSAEDDGE